MNRRIKFLVLFIAGLANIWVILSFAGEKEKELYQRRTSTSKLKLETKNPTSLIVLKSRCECKQHLEVVVKLDESHSTVLINDKTKNNSTEILNVPQLLNLTFTCDAFNVLSRGLNQKVIAFSLYGQSSRYRKNLKQISLQIKKFYPGWIMRVYHDSSVDENFICQIECLKDTEKNSLVNNAVFCDINQMQYNLHHVLRNNSFNADFIHGMKWRFLPIGDDFVDVFSSRDTDSLIIERELESVNVWLNSDKYAHIMRGFFYSYFLISNLFKANQFFYFILKIIRSMWL
jgi:hypothetical protein